MLSSRDVPLACDLSDIPESPSLEDAQREYDHAYRVFQTSPHRAASQFKDCVHTVKASIPMPTTFIAAYYSQSPEGSAAEDSFWKSLEKELHLARALFFQHTYARRLELLQLWFIHVTRIIGNTHISSFVALYDELEDSLTELEHMIEVTPDHSPSGPSYETLEARLRSAWDRVQGWVIAFREVHSFTRPQHYYVQLEGSRYVTYSKNVVACGYETEWDTDTEVEDYNVKERVGNVDTAESVGQKRLCAVM